MEFPKFAKLFDTESCGQIVATLGVDDNDDGYEIRFSFHPPDRYGLGICSVALGFGDDEEACKKCFNELDEEKATMAVSKAMNNIIEIMSESEQTDD